MALPTLLLALDMSVLYLAIPHLSEDLAPNIIWLTGLQTFFKILLSVFFRVTYLKVRG